jgi:excinuclease UvrABC ATPase subunit
MTKREPRMIPNPLWCERCKGRGYLVADAEWEPYAVQCPACADRRPARASGEFKDDAK